MHFRQPMALLPFLVAALALSACATSRTGKNLSDEDRAHLLISIGNGALNEGDPIGALQNYAQAEKIDAKIPELHHSKALAYRARQDMENAIASARRAVELRADYSDANNTLGKLLIDIHQLAEAEPYLQKAAKDSLYRDVYKPLTNLGILYYRKNDFGRAKIYMDKAVIASPNDACVAYYYRGHLRLRDSRFGEAIHDYEQATKRFCANFPDAHLALGIAYEKSRRYDMARKTFLEIQDRYPSTQVAEQAMHHLRYLP